LPLFAMKSPFSQLFRLRLSGNIRLPEGRLAASRSLVPKFSPPRIAQTRRKNRHGAGKS
jgi:hypothetical protein